MGYLFLAIPLTLFVLFVLPIWLWLHYGNHQQNDQLLPTQELQSLSQLNEQAQRMQQRIGSLEAMLDVEHPNWRENQ